MVPTCGAPSHRTSMDNMQREGQEASTGPQPTTSHKPQDVIRKTIIIRDACYRIIESEPIGNIAK